MRKINEWTTWSHTLSRIISIPTNKLYRKTFHHFYMKFPLAFILTRTHTQNNDALAPISRRPFHFHNHELEIPRKSGRITRRLPFCPYPPCLLRVISTRLPKSPLATSIVCMCVRLSRLLQKPARNRKVYLPGELLFPRADDAKRKSERERAEASLSSTTTGTIVLYEAQLESERERERERESWCVERARRQQRFPGCNYLRSDCKRAAGGEKERESQCSLGASVNAGKRERGCSITLFSTPPCRRRCSRLLTVLDSSFWRLSGEEMRLWSCFCVSFVGVCYDWN